MSELIEQDRKLTNNLMKTVDEYIKVKNERGETAKKFYDQFLKNYIFEFSKDKIKISEKLKAFFKKTKITLVSIDGTIYKRSRRGCLAFYVLAAPLTYELDLDKCTLIRNEGVEKKNVMVLLPIPLSEVFLLSEDITHDTKFQREETEESSEMEDNPIEDVDIELIESIRLGNVDIKLMKLAEVYATYWALINIKPDVIMYDGSLFKDYSFTNRDAKSINLWKGKILGNEYDQEFFEIVKAYPINKELHLPSIKFTKNFLIADLLLKNEIILKKKNSHYEYKSHRFDEDISVSRIQINNRKKDSYFEIEENNNEVKIKLKNKYLDSYNKLKKLFLDVCTNGFDNQNLDAFKIFLDEHRYRYFSEKDLDTLCRIGYLLIIEKCWQINTLLFSIIKDTTERSFIDYFLTVAGPRHIKKFNFNQKLLPLVPSTDAGMLFDISCRTKELHPPIACMEYDPAISSLYSVYNRENKEFDLIDIRGIQEREFIRTFVQISEFPPDRKSYVYTIDRIMYPNKDVAFDVLKVPIGSKAYFFAYYEKQSEILSAIVNLLTLISSNKHSAVFGYPDPLFDVDQYVKTIGNAHFQTLDIALSEIDLNEFSVSYRQGREIGGG